MTQSTTGKPLDFAEFQRDVSAAETQRTQDTWLKKAGRTFKRVEAGAYQITYNAQIYAVSGQQSWCQVKLDVDGSTLCRDRSNTGETVAKQSNGIVYKTYAAGDQPVISLDFRRQGGTGTIAIRRANVGIVKVEDS
jgi:hypothetical protein